MHEHVEKAHDRLRVCRRELAEILLYWVRLKGQLRTFPSLIPTIFTSSYFLDFLLLSTFLPLPTDVNDILQSLLAL